MQAYAFSLIGHSEKRYLEILSALKSQIRSYYFGNQKDLFEKYDLFKYQSSIYEFSNKIELN